MKDSSKLQRKLAEALNRHPRLGVSLRVPCTDSQFREIAWVVQDYVAHSGDVTNDDPLQEWLDEYLFFVSQGTGNPT